MNNVNETEISLNVNMATPEEQQLQGFSYAIRTGK